MSNPQNNAVDSFYTPPTTPAGDRDWRTDVLHWLQKRQRSAHPIDLNTVVVIDNLLDALDDARKQRDDWTAKTRAQCDLAVKRQEDLERAVREMAKIADDARSPGAWRYIGNPSDRIP